MGKTITNMGELGSGQAAKAVNQVIISGAYLGVAEGIVLGIKAGLDPHLLVEALSGGAAQSWVLANRSGRMIDDDYPLGFRLALHRKDLGIALDLARGLDMSLPVAELTAAIEDGLAAAGHGDEDMSVLAHAIRTIRTVKISAGPAGGPQVEGVSSSPGGSPDAAEAGPGPV
jgi:3-hydroxyisobutyrate dehydrogenase